jgi:hypothetical protein
MKTIIERPVDITNEFCYNKVNYRISPNLKQYEVVDYPVVTNDKYNDWTNDSQMDSVIVVDVDGEIKFLDQSGTNITVFVEQV